jgi:hypothetical protein
MCISLHVKYPIFLSVKLEFSRQIFENNQISEFVKIPPRGAELFREDGRIDMTKLIFLARLKIILKKWDMEGKKWPFYNRVVTCELSLRRCEETERGERKGSVGNVTLLQRRWQAPERADWATLPRKTGRSYIYRTTVTSQMDGTVPRGTAKA